MNPPSPDDRDHLFRLFGAFADGTLTAAESAQLAEALASSAETRRLWFLHQDVELGLEEWAAASSQTSAAALTHALASPLAPVPHIPATSPRPHRPAMRPTMRPTMRFAAAAALIAAAGIALWTFTSKPWPGNHLATLTRSSSAHWENTRLETGTPILSPHSLDLTSGIVELSMSSGALVVFEGPGRMEILSANSVRLHSGRVHATVPPAARGFTVDGNGFSVVDHGTEFGCTAPQSGMAEVHVFKGNVELKPWNRDARQLHGNQAFALNAESLEPIAARPELFISSADLDHQSSHLSALRDQTTRMLKNHPDAVVHFDASDVHASTLTNSASAANPASPITLQNCTLTDGREPDRKALYFNGKSSQLRFDLSRESHSLTLLAWVRSDVSSRRQDLVSGSGPILPGEIAWYLYYGNAMGFGAHTPAANLPNRGWHSLHSAPMTPRLSDWSLIATVVDAKANTITHFLNGKIVGMGQVSLPPILRLGPLIIGATTPDRNTRLQTCHFQGAIDEFSIIAAPLSTEEISRLYQLGRTEL